MAAFFIKIQFIVQPETNATARKILFLDRDGTLVMEPPEDYQLDRLEKLEFYPEVFRYLGKIVRELDYELVMITNQDGLGTESFPETDFWAPHQKIMRAFANEGITFREVLIDRSFPHENAPTRKPRTGLVEHYRSPAYDLTQSYVIGDRRTDMELAKNLGARGIWINGTVDLGAEEVTAEETALQSVIELTTLRWADIYQHLRLHQRTAQIRRTTKETDVSIDLDLDGTGQGQISTGLHFFDHMLDQIARHAGCDLTIHVRGDLQVDEHHTIEDTALALGDAFRQTLGNKLGLARYGFVLPMDDSLARVAIDFGGRPWLVWNADFRRERIGDVPTEMFFHFFKSFTDTAKCNLNVHVEGENEHHKIEAIFKAFARAIRMAIKRDPSRMTLPSTKGTL